jgi:hypothetical protein
MQTLRRLLEFRPTLFGSLFRAAIGILGRRRSGGAAMKRDFAYVRGASAHSFSRVVNDVREPDLFWALKGGGGGTFGVVTRLTLATHPLPETFGSSRTGSRHSGARTIRGSWTSSAATTVMDFSSSTTASAAKTGAWTVSLGRRRHHPCRRNPCRRTTGEARLRLDANRNSARVCCSLFGIDLQFCNISIFADRPNSAPVHVAERRWSCMLSWTKERRR